MKITCQILLTSLVLSILSANSCAGQTSDGLTGWPAGTSPLEIGKQVTENFLKRPMLWQLGERTSVVYFEVCTWYGALKFAKLTKDDELRKRLIEKYDVLLTPEGEKMISRREHVDFNMFGALPLEIYIQTGDKKFLKSGLSFAEMQWDSTTTDGITTQARYWIDDMYMINILLLQAYRATHDSKYLNQAALTTAAYLDKLQQPNGLFFHADDSRFYWSRGNGWFAAGMAELLKDLPSDHPRQSRIMEGYRTMMKSLLSYQGEDGLWRQLIDRPEFWPETSGTGMFAFAMVTGIKNGWLDAKTYVPAVRKAWFGLIRNLDSDGNLHEVCAGSNTAAMMVGNDPQVQLKYYLDRERTTGLLHGQAPLLWTVCALMH